MGLTEREKKEIRALAEASSQALAATVRALEARQQELLARRGAKTKQ